MSDHPPPTPLRGSPLKRMKRTHTSSPTSASATSAPSSPVPRLQGSPASKQAASQQQSTTPPTTPPRIADSDEEEDGEQVTSPTPKARPQAALRLAAPVAREALQVLDLRPFIQQGEQQEGMYDRLPVTDDSSERATRGSTSPSSGNSIDQDALFDQAQQMDGEASDSDSSLDVHLVPKAWDGDKGAMPSPRTAHARMRKFQDRTVKKMRKKAFREFMGDALMVKFSAGYNGKELLDPALRE